MLESEKINLFVGYDPNESIAYHVLVQSIVENTSIPVSITPVVKKQIKGFRRAKGKFESTEFSITRFFTPWLSDYTGWSLFIDCDFLLFGDLKELWDLRDERYSIMVCKHDYRPKHETKFLNNIQTVYEKKNWSSLVMFNNSKCKQLNHDYINKADGLDLHQFKWLESNDEIGEIPLEWNFLCGEDNQVGLPKGVHFTNGGPWFEETRNVEFSSQWFDMRSKALIADPFKSKFILINNLELEILNPMYKNQGKKADYIQLRDVNSLDMFHLKQYGFEHRGIHHNLPYIYMQALGSEFARFFNLSVQSCQVVRLNGNDFLFTKDIRGLSHVKGMEPLSYYSNRVVDKTRDLNLLKDELDFNTKENSAEFFTQMILFDTLIANTQRDARSIRIFEVDHSKYVEDFHSQIKTNHEFIIETNFGNYFFTNEEDKNPLYSADEIIQFIKENHTQEIAKKFLNNLNHKKVKGIIEGVPYLSSDMKIECLKVLEIQLEYLLPIEDFIFSD